MRKRTLLFGRSLKAVLFLAAVSICSMSARAQYEIKPGTARLQAYQQELSKYYLGENKGRIAGNAMLNENVFMFDEIGEGRFLMALHHQKTADYEKGAYVFANALPESITDETKANCFLHTESDFAELLSVIEAIRINNTLYVTGNQAITDISKLEEFVQAGSVQKIDLEKTNNFIFSFENTPEYWGDNDYTIQPETGGEVALDLIKGRIMVIFEENAQTSNIFRYEPVDDPNNFDNILYHRINFGNGDGPYTLEFSATDGYKLYENSGDYLNPENQSDRFGSCGGRYYNRDANGDYFRDSLGNIISYLGLNYSAQYPSTNTAFYVDTAYVNRGTGLTKPQYMLAVDTYIANDEYVIGRYAYNASMYAYEAPEYIYDNNYNKVYTDKYYDKTKGEGIAVSENETESGYYLKSNNFNIAQPIDYTKPRDGSTYLYNNMDRLAFSWAIHKGDSLYVLKGLDLNPVYKGAENDPYLLWTTLTKEYGVEGKSIDFAKLISENIVPESEYKAAYYLLGDRSPYPEMRTYYDYKPVTDLSPGKTIGLHAIIALDDNTHKDWVFSFVFIERNSTDCFIESETTDRNTCSGPALSPGYGDWLSFRNGVPTTSPTGMSKSELYNYMGGHWFSFWKTDASPVHNENPEAGDITAKATVIGGAGSVTIQNAAGKRITISNLLGQTIVRTKASSDNLSVSVPAGIVIVNIEGKKATKVIVK